MAATSMKISCASLLAPFQLFAPSHRKPAVAVGQRARLWARLANQVGTALAAFSVAAGMRPPLAAQASHTVQLYRGGRYVEAYQGLRTLIQQRGPLPVLLYDAGDALYRLGRYEEAAESFRGALGGPAGLGARTYYNMGTAYLKAAETEPDRYGALLRAVGAFEQALLMKPHDGDAKWNLELALRRLAVEEAQRSPGPTHRAGWGTGNCGKSGCGGQGGQSVAGAHAGGGAGAGHGQAAPRLSETEARQLLRAFQREQLKRHGGLSTENRGRILGDRDW